MCGIWKMRSVFPRKFFFKYHTTRKTHVCVARGSEFVLCNKVANVWMDYFPLTNFLSESVRRCGSAIEAEISSTFDCRICSMFRQWYLRMFAVHSCPVPNANHRGMAWRCARGVVSLTQSSSIERVRTCSRLNRRYLSQPPRRKPRISPPLHLCHEQSFDTEAEGPVNQGTLAHTPRAYFALHSSWFLSASIARFKCSKNFSRQ